MCNCWTHGAQVVSTSGYCLHSPSKRFKSTLPHSSDSCLPVVAGVVCNPAFSKKGPVGLHYCLLITHQLRRQVLSRNLSKKHPPERNSIQSRAECLSSLPLLMTASSLYLQVSGTSSDISTNSNSSILFTSLSGRESS